ncbi:hypothetical protein NDU88_008005 [Pleurodeles waltl]|uniref:Uncharacterized protein n=1 Tax=Pleurodeles waltl TaxID=8319 RepID=A0AAV7U4W9_PLEWA|nr:hypothetical protein NDU88_008005 [Pleurodeles waltl]
MRRSCRTRGLRFQPFPRGPSMLSALHRCCRRSGSHGSRKEAATECRRPPHPPERERRSLVDCQSERIQVAE